MTGKKVGATPRGCPQNAFLRLLAKTTTPRELSVEVSESVSRNWLLTGKEMVIGRDPSCQIVLDAMIYRMVSRRHAVVSSVEQRNGYHKWIICDLNSANG
ncbi:MAG: FHA domain-containing protein, partial [Dolichospermum sp.]